MFFFLPFFSGTIYTTDEVIVNCYLGKLLRYFKQKFIKAKRFEFEKRNPVWDNGMNNGPDRGRGCALVRVEGG